MRSRKKLLFVSNSSPSRMNHILDAFKNRSDLEVKVLNLFSKQIKRTFISKVFDKLRLPLDYDSLNQRILNEFDSFQPDYVFITKGNHIYPWTLNKIKKAHSAVKLVSWSLDDMYAKHNRSIFYTFGLKYYDIVFTSKSYNVEELKSLGAKKVNFLFQAFSSKYHRPCPNCNEIKNKSDVLFIGFAEDSRFEYLNYLADNGIKIDIYGSGWNKNKFRAHHENLNIHSFDLIGDDYSNAISCSKISLCFLRKANRDLHTSRSIEIPACGGFMVAERTDEHKLLFIEAKEAAYFDSKEELLDVVNYYLKHEVERSAIAQASYQRVKEDDYSYDDMVKRILNAI
jgi:spore maturation protein CgeB